MNSDFEKYKVCLITGTRAEYGLMLPLMRLIKQSKLFDLQLLVTGSHMRQEFKAGLDEITKEGLDYETTDIFDLDLDDEKTQMVFRISTAIRLIAEKLAFMDPKIVVLYGDRYEALAAALAANYMKIPIAHIGGGDLGYGGIYDECARHAITKLSHLHFTHTEKSRRRVISMGEERWRVFFSGILSVEATDLNTDSSTLKRYKVEKQSYYLLIFHPITFLSEENNKKIISAIINNLKGKRVIAISPNTDPMRNSIIKTIPKEQFDFYATIPHSEFLILLKNASAIIGNSSCGITEASIFGIPALDIGPRQNGRERGPNVVHIEETDLHEMGRALETLKSHRVKSKIYIGGGSQIIFDRILKNINNPNLLYKRWKD